jgi:hypothetical protein
MTTNVQTFKLTPTIDERHVSVRAVARWFAYDHLPEGEIREVSNDVADLAARMAERLPDSPELTLGLRNLLIAKDNLVRAAVDKAEREAQSAVAPMPEAG